LAQKYHGRDFGDEPPENVRVVVRVNADKVVMH
jgi:hypothetical protein